MTEFLLSLWHQMELYHFILLYVSGALAGAFIGSYNDLYSEDIFWSSALWPIILPLVTVSYVFIFVIKLGDKARAKKS